MTITIFNQRLEAIPLAFITITVIVLISLGNWQIKRLEQKEIFIKTIESNIKNPAIDIDSIKQDSPYYSKIKLSGKFSPRKNSYLYGRRSASTEKNGYYLISVFEADNGLKYLVSRGWLPQTVKDKLKNQELNINHSEPTTIEAIILPGEKKSIFVPENDYKNNIWFTLDLTNLGSNFDNISTDYYLMEIESKNLPEGGKMLYANNLSKIKNDHLEYAITWYSLAACLLVMFIIYSRKQKQDDN